MIKTIVTSLLFSKLLVKSFALNCSSINVESNDSFINYGDVFKETSFTILSSSCPCNVQPCINLCCDISDNRCSFERVKTKNAGFIYFYGISCQNDQMDETVIKKIRAEGSDLLVYYSKYGRDEKKKAMMPKCDNKSSEIIKICQAIVPSDKNKGFFKTPFSIIVISLTLLICLFLIYLSHPKLQNLHEKALMWHIFCVIIAYIVFIVRWGYAVNVIYLCPKIRTVLGIILYYMDLSSIFWLNVMCFDIWWGIRALKLSSSNINSWTLPYYTIYALCAPALVTLMGTGYFAMWHGKEAAWPDPMLEIEPQWFYHISIGLLITLNIIFFIWTSVYIYKTHKNIMPANRQTKKDFNRVYFRLMIIMIPECRYIILLLLYYTKALKSVTAAHIQSYFYVCHGIVTFLVYASSTKIRKIILNRIMCTRSEYSISSQEIKT